eukprot:scaffold10944_cov110-Isochrysis_galbana.AAC.5
MPQGSRGSAGEAAAYCPATDDATSTETAAPPLRRNLQTRWPRRLQSLPWRYGQQFLSKERQQLQIRSRSASRLHLRRHGARSPTRCGCACQP